MKVFISHSKKDEEIAKTFSYFIKNLCLDNEVYCSSISGTISQGEDFVKSIENGLKNSDVFIPIISNNYNQSKYCLIELGYAYARNVLQKTEYYIMPFCIPPVTKDEALLDTPLSHLNTALLNDKDDLQSFLRLLIRYKLIPENSIMNSDEFSFINRINNIVMKLENILGNAVFSVCCSDGVNRDAVQYIKNDNKHIVNFNLFADGKNKRPDFISFVIKFPVKFNLYTFLNSNIDMKFVCEINNYTDSLTDIDIEFKYQYPPQLLKNYRIRLNSGLNNIEIPIRDMNIDGLKQIYEICFVCWDSYITEIEGMFSVENIQVR